MFCDILAAKIQKKKYGEGEMMPGEHVYKATAALRNKAQLPAGTGTILQFRASVSITLERKKTGRLSARFAASVVERR